MKKLFISMLLISFTPIFSDYLAEKKKLIKACKAKKTAQSCKTVKHCLWLNEVGCRVNRISMNSLLNPQVSGSVDDEWGPDK
ncbi:MAG: hypothetical protein AAF518_01250 [Spirochaetota bacterium]